MCLVIVDIPGEPGIQGIFFGIVGHSWGDVSVKDPLCRVQNLLVLFGQPGVVPALPGGQDGGIVKEGHVVLAGVLVNQTAVGAQVILVRAKDDWDAHGIDSLAKAALKGGFGLVRVLTDEEGRPLPLGENQGVVDQIHLVREIADEGALPVQQIVL